jgi:hypothetical protein
VKLKNLNRRSKLVMPLKFQPYKKMWKGTTYIYKTFKRNQPLTTSVLVRLNMEIPRLFSQELYLSGKAIGCWSRKSAKPERSCNVSELKKLIKLLELVTAFSFSNYWIALCGRWWFESFYFSFVWFWSKVFYKAMLTENVTFVILFFFTAIEILNTEL